MGSNDLTPPMFPIKPPFPNMGIGKIRISHSGGETMGELIPYHFPQDHLFGARIDILGPMVYGCSLILVLKLSQQLLQTIQRTDDANFPYAITIAEDLCGLFPSSLTRP
jgi:hypothetical protein